MITRRAITSRNFQFHLSDFHPILQSNKIVWCSHFIMRSLWSAVVVVLVLYPFRWVFCRRALFHGVQQSTSISSHYCWLTSNVRLSIPLTWGTKNTVFFLKWWSIKFCVVFLLVPFSLLYRCGNSSYYY